MLDDKKLLLSYLLSRLEGAASTIRDGLFTFVGHPYGDRETYNIHDPWLTTKSIDILIEELVDAIDAELDNEFRTVRGLEHVAELIDIENFKSIKDICYSSPIYDLAEFDAVEHAGNLLSRWSVHNEDMNDASQAATDRAAEKQYDLAVAAAEPVKKLFDLLEWVKESFQAAVKELDRLEKQQTKIDNT